MIDPILAPSNTWYKGTTNKSSITIINIVDDYTATGDESESWNADVDNSGSIKCYISGTILTIAGNGSGKIVLNADSSKAFYGSTAADRFTSVTDINGADLLDASNVTSMYAMFTMCSKLTFIDVSNWDTSNVTDMRSMFNLNTSLQSVDVSNWNTGKVTSMNAMFQVCISLIELDLSKWDVSQVTDMANMFYSNSNYGAMKLTSIGDISNWDTGNVTTMAFMFGGCTSIEELDISNWNVSRVTTMKAMFQGLGSNSYDMKIKSLDVSKWITSSLTDTGWMLYGCANLTAMDLSSWDASKITSTDHMFCDCIKLQSINFNGWNTSSLTNMNAMFNECYGLSSLDISMFDTSKVEKFSQMFEYCSSLREIIGIEDIDTSSGIMFTQMFTGCLALKSLDLSRWNVKNAEYLDSMFTNSGLERISIEGWSSSTAISLTRAFQGCESLVEINLSNLNLSQIEYFYQIFNGCSTLEELDLRFLDTSKAINVQDMFAGMTKLKKITLGEKFSFNGCGTLDSNYPNVAILPTPNAAYIDSADGNWYNANNADAYAPADVPGNTIATYLAAPAELTCGIYIKYGTLVRIADAIRAITSSKAKLSPDEMIETIKNLRITENLFDITKLTKLETSTGIDRTDKLSISDDDIITITSSVYGWGVLYWLTQTYMSGTYKVSFEVMNSLASEQSPSNSIYCGFGIGGTNDQVTQSLSGYQQWESYELVITNTADNAYFYITPLGGNGSSDNYKFRNIVIKLVD